MQDMGAFAMELMGPAGIMKEEVPHAITVRAAGMSHWQRGEKIGLVPQPGAVHLFDAETGDRLPD